MDTLDVYSIDSLRVERFPFFRLEQAGFIHITISNCPEKVIQMLYFTPAYTHGEDIHKTFSNNVVFYVGERRIHSVHKDIYTTCMAACKTIMQLEP